MNTLFDNAVQSIPLGVEDYQANDPRRALSSVRNFYAGVLLLAKEVLVRQVPDSAPEDVLAARFKPIPDGQGGCSTYRQAIRPSTFPISVLGLRTSASGSTMRR